MTLSVVIITHNEEANLARTLASVEPLVADGKGEIIVVDSGSTDRTVEIAKSFGAKVFLEEWKGYAAQKNSAIDKATGDWILSLDADEELSPGLGEVIARAIGPDDDSPKISGAWISRKNFFLGRWIRHGGFYPDRKLRLFRHGKGRFEIRHVHETIRLDGKSYALDHSYDRWGSDISIIHHSYPTLSDYIDHMNRYSSLGAEMVVAKASGKVRIQRNQHRPAPAGNVHLQLFLPPRFPRRPRRPAAAPLPRSLCFVEVREGVGTRTQAASLTRSPPH